MVSIVSLWLPIVLSAVLVFVASSLIHMLLSYHRSDFAKLPDEDGVMSALRAHDVPPGNYVMPCAASSAEMRSDAFLEKANAGPVAFMTVLPSGPPAIGASLVQWFVYCLVIGVFTAYVTSRALGPGAEYLSVFRMSGTVAFIGYAMSLPQDSIWYKKSWTTTLKSIFDGVVYGLLTAGAFGWLWPSA